MKNKLLYISAFLLLSIGMTAQTSNQGMLYVSEGTQFSTVERFDNLVSGSFFNDGDAFIYSHFNNDGIVDFYQNTGLTRFIGRSNQSISGTKVSYLYDTYFNNTSNTVPFEVSGSINISGEADLYSGILDNDNFGGEITFNTEAYHINTSDYSHVDGYVNKVGENEFTFPIGDGGYYRFAGISAPENESALFEAKFYFENTNAMYPHKLRAGILEEIDNQEYWTITKESSANEDMLITLSWRDVTTPQSMIDAAEQDALTIVRWNEDTNMWVDEGGAIDLENKTVTTAVNGYGVFTFGRVKSDLVLPCNIVVYTAVTPNGDGKNDYFLIDTSNNECARNLNVEVYNRWGVKVFETDNYGLDGDVFDGFSTGRLTVDEAKQLPTGTYYYILDYQYGNPSENNRHKQAGFLYLSGN
ncbi:gliding motility-associated C-terminal domain-containing protein [Aequorivita marina]|uniref:gliding motility-associated C-terminal domain-containing protein n=1 Tax=Aequorivita marina TaxID=3073654 RepID=UPI0028751774|nr:gliding motility-associated C-terminal domain-containing protein [Aequorivita sp. S2608]MDS1297909.1 gliding motility-associated C-terminal domain-containing protein [Aequorivita sp. S2608]